MRRLPRERRARALPVPLLPAGVMAFVALMSTRALAELKRRYDPQPDRDEEAV